MSSEGSKGPVSVSDDALEVLFSEFEDAELIDSLRVRERQIAFDFARDMSAFYQEAGFGESADFAGVQNLPESPAPEQLDKVIVPLFRYLLQSGEKGYKDGIDYITDGQGNPPSQQNAWLAQNEEASEFAGLFVDVRPGADRVFSFTIRREGKVWNREIVAVSGIQDEGEV